MEINGVAHTQLSVNNFDACVAFYDRLVPYPGLHHICFRARSREDIDELHGFLQELGAHDGARPRRGRGRRATTRSRSSIRTDCD